MPNASITNYSIANARLYTKPPESRPQTQQRNKNNKLMMKLGLTVLSLFKGMDACVEQWAKGRTITVPSLPGTDGYCIAQEKPQVLHFYLDNNNQAYKTNIDISNGDVSKHEYAEIRLADDTFKIKKYGSDLTVLFNNRDMFNKQHPFEILHKDFKDIQSMALNEIENGLALTIKVAKQTYVLNVTFPSNSDQDYGGYGGESITRIAQHFDPEITSYKPGSVSIATLKVGEHTTSQRPKTINDTDWLEQLLNKLDAEKSKITTTLPAIPIAEIPLHAITYPVTPTQIPVTTKKTTKETAKPTMEVAASATNSQIRTIKVKQTTKKPSAAATVPTSDNQIPTTINSRNSKSSRSTSLTIALITSASVLLLGALLLTRYLSGKNSQENTLYHQLTDVISTGMDETAL